MFDGFILTFLSLLNIDNGIKFTYDTRLHTIYLKVIYLMEHGMVKSLNSFLFLGIMFLTFELQV